MARYKAKAAFSTTVMWQGTNQFVICRAGDDIDLESEVAALVNNDVGTEILVLKKASTKTPKGKTRQVKSAANRSS